MNGLDMIYVDNIIKCVVRYVVYSAEEAVWAESVVATR
jgi:hypothetical protein